MSFAINGRLIGAEGRTYVIAEMSANHNQDLEQATAIVKAAKASGADAVKLQTYTPDTMTIDCDRDDFRIQKTIWAGNTLYDLYGEAYTPWEWQPKLKEVADRLGLDLFSTPFDPTAVDFLGRVSFVMLIVMSKIWARLWLNTVPNSLAPWSLQMASSVWMEMSRL